MSSCENCGKEYTDVIGRWCKPCQIDNLKGKFTDWTSGNEKIDYYIQEMQLKVDKYDGIVFEWILYNQFSDIKETGKDTVSSAVWKDGPLEYDRFSKREYTRKSN